MGLLVCVCVCVVFCLVKFTMKAKEKYSFESNRANSFQLVFSSFHFSFNNGLQQSQSNLAKLCVCVSVCFDSFQFNSIRFVLCIFVRYFVCNVVIAPTIKQILSTQNLWELFENGFSGKMLNMMTTTN